MSKVKITKAQKKLVENEIISLATSDLKGKSNVIAVACCNVVSDNKILITDNFMNKTRKNLLKNKRVALAVWRKDGEEAYQFKGKAQYLTSGRWKKVVDEDPKNKGFAHKAAVLVKINEIWDLAHPKLLVKE